jgi:HemY protein
MIWSLIKIVLFVCVVAMVALLGGYLLEADGGLRVEFAGMEYNLTPFLTVVALVLLVFAVWLFLKLMGVLVATWKFLNGDETALSRYFDRNRERKGYDALSEGMTALAAGEGREAMAKAARAEKYLDRPELTNLLTAQAAEMSGDTKKAAEVYKKLVSNPATRFVGVRGIMKQKLSEGDTTTALALAEKAFALKPKHVETQDVLLNLQAKTEDWSGARKTLSAKLKSGSLPRDVHRRRDAVLALSEAKVILAEDSTIEAREAAIAANKLSPDLIPAAVMAAQSYIDQNKPRYASRVVTKAWAAKPHPDLAAVFASIAPDETPAARLKRFNTLTRQNKDNPETIMLMTELHIANEDFPTARRTLGDLAETDPSGRALTLMAAIERGEGADDAVVRGWLTKAVTSPRGPQWVCSNCHSIHTDWMPVCSTCESFDTLSWTSPPEAEVSMPSNATMLPLIVGEPEPEAPSEDDLPEVQLLEAEDVVPEDAKPAG